MADIIDFKAKNKNFCTQTSKNNHTELGEIILFSGVRIERDVKLKSNSIKTNDTVFLTKKTH